MSQEVIKQQLVKFLELSNSQETLDLQKSLREQGYCHGFAMCFASMNAIGKLDCNLGPVHVQTPVPL